MAMSETIESAGPIHGEQSGHFEQHTVFFCVHQGFATRYFLRTDIFRVLKAAGVRIVILTPNSDETYFCKEFEGSNVFIEELKHAEYSFNMSRSRIQKFLQFLRLLTLSDKGNLATIRRREIRSKPQARGIMGKLQQWLVCLIVPLFRRSFFMRNLLIGFESLLFTPDCHRELFHEYKPDMVLVSGLGYWSEDAYLMREARRHEAMVVPVILSWDNTSTKGMAGARPDYVIAWTENMKQELVTYHDIAPDKIFVGGVAHYDIYYTQHSPISWSELSESLGLAPDRRLLLFATGSPTVYSDVNADIVRMIGQAIQRDDFVQPCQLLIRVHPIYLGRGTDPGDESKIDELRRLVSGFSHVFLDVPETKSEKLGFDMPSSDMYRLRTMLENASVLVNQYSTLMLEASIMDVPIINAGLDTFNEKLQDVNSCVEDYPHLRRIIAAGCATTARNEQELIKYINAYLSDPALNAIGRRAVRTDECGPNKGRAGAAIAECILSLLSTGDIPRANNEDTPGHQKPEKVLSPG
jgi:hypothetical protein